MQEASELHIRKCKNIIIALSEIALIIALWEQFQVLRVGVQPGCENEAAFVSKVSEWCAALYVCVCEIIVTPNFTVLCKIFLTRAIQKVKEIYCTF